MYAMLSNQGVTEHDSFVNAVLAAIWQAQFSGSATVVRTDSDHGVEVIYDEDDCECGSWSYRAASV